MRYSLTFFITFLISAGVWYILFCCQLGQPMQSGKWNYDAYDYKREVADKVSTNKVVIVAGSNGLFGFDCGMLSEAFGMPVVNGAVNAGLGMDYILYKSKNFLKRGDIAVLPLEYSFYQSEAFGGTVLADYTIAWDLEYYKQLSFIRKINIMTSVDDKRLFRGIKSLFIQKEFVDEPMYNLKMLDEYGDHKNMNPDVLPSEFYEHKRDNLEPDIRKNSKLSRNFIRIMDDYIEWAEDNNITLVFIPQAQMYFSIYDNDVSKDFYKNILKYYEDRGVLFVGDPYDYMFPKEDILDTKAHLNLKGVSKRMQLLIGDFQPYIKHKKLSVTGQSRELCKCEK
jgi:hypothetical protein